MMRSAVRLVSSLAIAGMVATVGHAGALAGDEATDAQVVELPGYGASLVLSEDWIEGDTMGRAFGSLYPGSEFHDRVTTTIEDPDGGRWCAFTAWSRLACDSAVDARAEVGPADVTSVVLPAGDALRTDSIGPPGVCYRYLLGDTVDLYSLRCCGMEAEPDAFFSVAQGIELPTEPRTSRLDDEQGLVAGIHAVASMVQAQPAGDTYWTIYSPTQGDHVAHHSGWLGRLEVATGVSRNRIETVRAEFEDEAGEMLLAVAGLHAPGAGSDAVLNGYLDWMSNEWGRWSREHPGETPRYRNARLAERDIVRVDWEDGETEILYADGASVVGFRGPRLELVPAWLGALDCGHVDVDKILFEALIEEFRSRP